MKTNLKYIIGVALVLLVIISSCTEDTYSLGDLTAPSNIVINTEIIGQDATHPDGDGSGEVKISVTGDNILGVKIDYDANDEVDFKFIPKSVVTKKFDALLGVNTYKVTVLASGPGGTTTTVTKDITVRYDFLVDPLIVTNLTGDTSKTWIVDKSVAGHFGVGPWNVGSIRPEWWAGGINEKVNCCNCFYTASFTFTKDSNSGTFSLQVATPDGAFTKTGSLAGIPNIPSSGDEGCYDYSGANSSFIFSSASSGAPAIGTGSNSNSTQTSIKLSGGDTFIGYGATQKEYEILELTSNYMFLRVQGTETGNAWYIKLIPSI
ncbi:MAG: hypothetical protein K9I95_12525 [Flavobacteriaceae bacterium]|nr:hypothetical protein [Flavobacteriaceae bacterium]